MWTYEMASECPAREAAADCGCGTKTPPVLLRLERKSAESIASGDSRLRFINLAAYRIVAFRSGRGLN